MFRAVVAVLCCACAASAMSVKALKKVSYVSPDGGNSMWFERSASTDLDSSATGYVYNNDGLGPATILHLNSHPALQAFQQINHGFDTVGQPVHEFSKGEGSLANSGYYANGGVKGGKGYNGFDAFQKGILKKFDKKGDSGFYQDAAGNKKAHHDAAGHYGSFNQASQGESGGKFGEESSHKKGHKTTGFHKVYHKDEFKKEHSFYDEADKNGHHDKYEKGQSGFGASKGAFQHGGHQDSGYQVGEHGNKGFFDKGNVEEQDEGYQGVKGSNSHFSDNSEFANQGGEGFQKGYGYGLGY